MEKIKKILLTGIDGYIGSVLADLLRNEGFTVVGLDTGYFKEQVLGLLPDKEPIMKKDIRQISDLDFGGYDAVIHLAALSNDPMGDLKPELTAEINFLATTKLAELAKKQKVKRFIFSSSCSIYGITKEPMVTEKSVVNPLTIYAKSKFNVEKKLQALADKNFCVGILRNSTVYGYSPKFRNDLVVNDLVTSSFITKQIRIKSDGTPWRPLIDVRDLGNIFIEFLKKDINQINGEIFNIGFNSSNYQVKDICKYIKYFLPQCEIVFTKEHGSDSRSYRVDFSKFNRLFNINKPQWPLERSIEDLLVKLEKFSFTDKDLESKKFVRLEQLKKLLTNNKIDTNLYWKNEK